MSAGLKAVVLAAGKGSRFQEGGKDEAKVMSEVCGKPLLSYVLDALSFVARMDVVIVVGYKKEDVIARFSGYAFAHQTEQLGTGHAVMAAQRELSGFDGDVLVCYGDMPAVRSGTYKALIRAHYEQGNDCTILTGESALPLQYGRIIRDQSGGFLRVVEEKDCTPEQLKIRELNSGVYVFKAVLLFDALKSLDADNAQGEYYLTDAPAIMLARGDKVGLCKLDLCNEILGVNTHEQLAQVGEILSAH